MPCSALILLAKWSHYNKEGASPYVSGVGGGNHKQPMDTDIGHVKRTEEVPSDRGGSPQSPESIPSTPGYPAERLLWPGRASPSASQLPLRLRGHRAAAQPRSPMLTALFPCFPSPVLYCRPGVCPRCSRRADKELPPLRRPRGKEGGRLRSPGRGRCLEGLGEERSPLTLELDLGNWRLPAFPRPRKHISPSPRPGSHF